MRHLLAIADLSRAEIERLLDSAEALGRGQVRSLPTGTLIANLFLEPSTRTRVSFETAAKRLGAEVVNLSAAGSSVTKGETLADTARTLDAMGPAAIVVRHSYAGSAVYLASRVKAVVINAGDGAHEHPTQALLDALTIRKRLGTLDQKTIAIVGDIRHSRVARSGIHCFTRLGARVRVCGPPTLIPPGIERLGCTATPRLEKALEGADVVMALRIQQERMSEAFFPSLNDYSAGYRIDSARLKLAHPGAIVMHPGPMNRGVEISSEVADSQRSVVGEQVANGVLVRMAVLDQLLNLASSETKKAGGSRR